MPSFPPPNSGRWTTGLWGCFQDLGVCCCGFWCPQILVGRYVEIIDQGATSCCAGGSIFCCLQLTIGCGCLYTCIYRSRLRQKYGLPASPCYDVITDSFCLPCSTCQVYRELENRGVDPKLGHAGAKQAYAKSPPVLQAMGIKKEGRWF